MKFIEIELFSDSHSDWLYPTQAQMFQNSRLEKLILAVWEASISRHHGGQPLDAIVLWYTEVLRGIYNGPSWCWETLVSRTAMHLIAVVSAVWSKLNWYLSQQIWWRAKPVLCNNLTLNKLPWIIFYLLQDFIKIFKLHL